MAENDSSGDEYANIHTPRQATGASDGLILDQQYIIEYRNRKRVIGVWDGRFFKIQKHEHPKVAEADTVMETDDVTSNAAGDADTQEENKEDEKKKEEEEQKKKEKPFVGLMANKKSVVTAVFIKDIELMTSLLQQLKIEQAEADAKKIQEAEAKEKQEVDAASDKAEMEEKVEDKVVDKTQEETKSDSTTTTNESSSQQPSTDLSTAAAPSQPSTSTQSETEKEGESKMEEEKEGEKDGKKKEDKKEEKEEDMPEIQFPKLTPKAEISQAVMVAITTGQADMLDKLLEEGQAFGVDLHIVDSWCPLICTAAQLGKVDVFKVILKHCTDITVSGHYGNVLHHAVRSGNYDLVELILQQGKVDVKAVSEVSESTVLMEAVRCAGQAKMLEQEDKASENASGDATENASGNTSKNASENTSENASENAMDTNENSSSSGTRNLRQRSDIFYGNKPRNRRNKLCSERKAAKRDLRILEKLISLGCDVNQKDKHQKTALHYATLLGYKEVMKFLTKDTIHGYREVIEFLLKHGADKTVKDSNDKTAFMYALFFTHSHLYDLLILPDTLNEAMAGEHLLHFAAKECSPHAIHFLVSKGADPLLVNDQGQTALVTALLKSNTDAMRALAKQRPNGVDIRDNDGLCAIHHAMNQYNETGRAKKGEFAEILLENGADIDAKDKHGRTALLLCGDDAHGSADSLEAYEFLLKHGANPDFRTANGLYPLLQATESNSAEKYIKLLLKYHVDMTKSQYTCARAQSHEDKDGVRREDHVNKTPLEVAISNAAYDTVTLLLAADTCLNQVHEWFAMQLNPGGALANSELKWQPLLAYLRQCQHTPMGLKGITRLAVLRQLGREGVQEKINELEIPKIMMDYLKWESYIKDRMFYIESFVKEWRKSDSAAENDV